MSRLSSGSWSLLSACGLVLLAVGCEHEAPSAAPKHPPVVLVTTPSEGVVTDYEEFTGRTEASKTVEVRARVTGYLEKLLFEDGAEVEAGTPLFKINDRTYKAELELAEGTLAQAVAKEKMAEANYRRRTALYLGDTVSQEELDLAVDQYAEARAAIQIAKAQRDIAAINLGYTEVEAEIDGRLSRRLVDVGNLIQADVTPLTTLVAIDKLYVYFEIDERTLLKLRRFVQQGRIQSRAQGAEIAIEAALADSSDFNIKGIIDFSDNRVDVNTGTLSIRAVIDNPEPHFLSPGLFLRVRLPIGEPRKALLVPERALQADQDKKYLYVINDKNEAVYRQVETGTQVGLDRVVEEGVSKGDRVVVSGTQRIRPGVEVVPRPAEEAIQEDVSPGERPSGPASDDGPKPSG